MTRRCRHRVALPAAWALATLLAGSAVQASDRLAVVDLPLEQLREVLVTTVSRQPEALADAAAAAYVITGDDIRRSGATTLPEALRLVPGLDVAQADSNQYALSARGFNNVLANKMLVLIDGRTVYSPLFSGVFWEAQGVLLDDVDRIEVVTGPSTALWGSNAVNGLVHVITRNAAATPGTLVNLRAGDREQGLDVRQGFALTGGAQMRLYAQQYRREDSHRADGSSVFDAAHGGQAGFRADWAGTDQTFTAQGDVVHGRIDQVGSARDFSGANLLTRWQHRLGPQREVTLQASVDTTQRDHPGVFQERLSTVDVVGQVALVPGPRQHLLLGAGVRHADDRVDNSVALAFLPASRAMTWTRLFAQNRIDLTGTLALTVAGSAERNPYTGIAFLPNVRLAWRPVSAFTLWGGWSRAVRAPSRSERDLYQPGTAPYLVAGGPQFEAEVADVIELGSRGTVAPGLAWSANGFRYHYHNLRSLAPTAQGLQWRNGIEGDSRGVEATLRWKPGERWQLDAAWTVLDNRLRVVDGQVDVGGLPTLGNDPGHWGSLRGWVQVAPAHQWSLAVRRVGPRPAPVVPGYTAVDSRWAWQVRRAVELSFTVRNLFDARHPEWGVATNRVEVERALLVQLRWQR